MYVDMCAILCCFGMLKEFIFSCHLCELVAINFIEMLYLLGMGLGEFKLTSFNVHASGLNFNKQHAMHAEALTFNCHFPFRYPTYLWGNLKA